MSQANDTVKMTGDFFKAVTIGSAQISEALVNMFEQHMGHANYRFLYEHIRNGGSCQVVFCQNGIYEHELKPELEKEGIITVPYEMILNNGKVTEGFLCTEEQVEKVNQIRNRVLIGKGLLGRVDKEDLEKASKGSITRINNVDPSVAKQVSDMAGRSRFSVSMELSPDGKTYTLYCLPEHKNKVVRSMLAVSFMNKKDFGSFSHDRAMFELDTEARLNKHLEDPNAHFFVSDEFRPYPYLEFDGKDVTYHWMDKGIERTETMDRFDESSKSIIAKRMKEFQKPMCWDADAFSLDEKERRKLLRTRYKRPSAKKELLQAKQEAEKETASIMKLYDEKHQKTEEKMLFFDNREQRESDVAITNDLVSFSEFFAHQWVNDMHDLEELVDENMLASRNGLTGVSVDIITLKPDLDAKIQEVGGMERDQNREDRADNKSR